MTSHRGPAGIDPLTTPVLLGSPVEPGPIRLILRPFGYLAMTLVWILICAFVIGVTLFALPVALVADDPAAGFQASPLFHGADSWMAFLVIPFMLMPVFGSISYLLILSSAGMMLSAGTLFARSLRPSYRHEQLSGTIFSREAIGQERTALSLLPLRLSRWSKLVMMIQFNGWIPNVSTFLTGTAWGALYLFTVGWILWPATGIAAILCTVVSALLGAACLVVIWRRRHSYRDVMPDRLRGTRYEYSWPHPAGQALPGRRR